MSQISDIYQQYLHRAARPDEESFWQGQLNGGMSIGTLSSQISGSPEAKAYSAPPTQTAMPTQIAPVQAAPGVTTAPPVRATPGITDPNTASPYESPGGWAAIQQQIDEYNRIDNSYDGGLQRGTAMTNAGLQGFGTPVSFADGTYGVNRANASHPGYNNMLSSDGKGGVQSYEYKADDGGWLKYLPMVLGTVLTAGTLGPALFGAEAAAGAGAGWVSAEGGAGYLGGMAADSAALAAGNAAALSTGVQSAVDGSVSGAPGWNSGYDLPGGGDMAPPIEAPPYSNEGANYPTTESTGTSPINATTGPGAAPTIDLSGPTTTPPYSNEGAHYTTPGSTTTSPINSTTGPGAAPTVPLTSPGGTPTLPKIPPIPGTGTGTGTSGTGTGGTNDMASLFSTLYDAWSKNNLAQQLGGSLDSLNNLYKPGSAEANLMRQTIERKDAAAGRRSQYGPREVELAGKLANMRANVLTSPGYMTMQQAYLNNNPSTGGLGQLFSAFAKGTGGTAGITDFLKQLYNGGQTGGTPTNSSTPGNTDSSGIDVTGGDNSGWTNGYDL